MNKLDKDIQRYVTFQDGRTYVMRLRAGIRPMIDFREKGKKEWSSLPLEIVHVQAVRAKLA